MAGKMVLLQYVGVSSHAQASGLLPYFAGLGVDETTAGHAISVYALGVVVGAPLLAGLGWTSGGYVGAAVALGGFGVWCIAMLAERRALNPAALQAA